jgi:hypothetical protein
MHPLLPSLHSPTSPLVIGGTPPPPPASPSAVSTYSHDASPANNDASPPLDASSISLPYDSDLDSSEADLPFLSPISSTYASDTGESEYAASNSVSSDSSDPLAGAIRPPTPASAGQIEPTTPRATPPTPPMSWLAHIIYDHNRDVEHDQHHFVPQPQTNSTARTERLHYSAPIECQVNHF